MRRFPEVANRWIDKPTNYTVFHRAFVLHTDPTTTEMKKGMHA